MMKSLRFFIMALLCAVFCNAMAEESVFYTLEPATGSNNSYTGNCDVIISGITWNVSGNAQMVPWRIGGKSITSVNRTVYSKTSMNSEISKVQLTVGGASNITVNSLTLTVASNEDFSTVIENVSATFAANSTITFSPSEGKKWENAYFKFTFNVTVSGSSNKFVEFERAQFYTLSSTSTVATPTFSPAGGTYTSAQNVTISCETVGAKIYYTTDGSDPKSSETRSQYSKAISVTKSGTTIKAYAEMDDMDDSNIASATYTIIPENPSITQEGNTITMSAATGCTIYYNTGTNYSDTNDPTNASTPYTGPIEMTESAYFKAIAYDEYGNPSGIRSFDFKYSNVIPHPKNINSNYYVKVTDASELEDGDAILIVGENNNNFYAMGEQKDSNRGAVGVSVDNNVITITNEKVQKIIFVDASDNANLFGYFYVGEKGYLYASSSSSNQLKSQTPPSDNAKAKISFNDVGVPTVTFQGSNSRNWMKFNYNNGGSPLFNCYASNSTTGTDIEIYKEVLAPFELVIHPKATDGKNNYYATISNLGEGNFVVPEGLEVSTITIVNRNINKTQSWTKDGVIPGDKAYYVVAAGLENPTPDDLTFTFVPSTNTEVISLQDNWLYPAIAGQVITAPDDENEYLFYKLTLDANDTDGSIGFYFGDDNGGTFSFSNDHKAYLAVPQNGDSNEGMSSIVVGDFTGISDIQPNKEQNNEVYTLSGVRVKGNLPKGIYIVNGKKQIVK
ncbi:MAG: chitobiase/beta-hexosaminidase C-terminal domain-containing protein [Prevotella sp.]|nr:chitobiase/beta-hexosaminidase C-terminal domain-containing protein [Prevotella sp.]